MGDKKTHPALSYGGMRSRKFNASFAGISTSSSLEDPGFSSPKSKGLRYVASETPNRWFIRSDACLLRHLFCRELPEIVQLRAADGALFHSFDLGDARGVQRKHALHADAVRDFADGEGRVNPGPA